MKSTEEKLYGDIALTRGERIAYQDLKNRGYTNIIKNTSNDPDFTCDEKDRYEIKELVGTSLIFSSNQIENFKPTDNILVYHMGQLLYEFKWKDRESIKRILVEKKAEWNKLNQNLLSERKQILYILNRAKREDQSLSAYEFFQAIMWVSHHEEWFNGKIVNYVNNVIERTETMLNEMRILEKDDIRMKAITIIQDEVAHRNLKDYK